MISDAGSSKGHLVESIYLNENDLNKLIALDFTNKPNLERIRDLFLIGCYTGLRYSDFSEIQPANIAKDGNQQYLNIRTQKTDERVVIPLKPKVIEI